MTSVSRDEKFEKQEAFGDVILAMTSDQPEVQETQDDIVRTVTLEHSEVEGTQYDVIPTVTQEHSEFKDSQDGNVPTVNHEHTEVEGQYARAQRADEPSELTLEGLEQTNVISPEKDGSSHKYILLPCSVKVKVRVKCGGCGKEAEVNEDDASLDLAEASYICDICKSRAQKKLRLHQLINGGTFAQEPERVEPKRKHPCPHCNKEFNSQKDMKRHTNIHTGLRPYVCDTCGKAFSQSCSLKRHLVTHTDLKPHRCEVCGLTFKGHLARHMRSHTGEKPFTCEICQKGFYRSELLKRHLAEHMTDGTVSCSKTQLDDIFQRSLAKQHTCLICDKTYTNSGHLARHMKQHNNENVLRCGVCTKVFYVKEQLQEHLQGHSKEDLAAIIAGTLLPTMTNGSPPTSDIDEAPMKEEEPTPGDFTPMDLPPQNIVPGSDMLEHACLEDRVTCGICGHACCCTNYIPLHMENHEEAMVQCRSCGMDFAPTSANNGSQICSLCKPQETGTGAEAETNNVLDDVQDEVQEDVQDDRPVEDEEKRHKCLECDKSYKFIKHLREHARIHGGGYRPYRCNTCGKSFTKRYHLNRHQLIHGRLLQRQQSQSRTLPGLKPKVGRPLKYIETKPKVGRPPQHIETKRKVGRPLKHTEMKAKVGRPRLTETKPIVPVKEYRYTRPKVNAGGMPFVCSACGKGFPKRVPLKRHLLNHLHQGTIPKDHPQLDEMKVNSYVNANVGDAPSPQLQSCPICNKACKGLHLHRHMKVHTQEEIEKCKEASVGASPQAQAQAQAQAQQQQQQQHKMQQPEILSGPAQGEIDFEKDGSPMDDDYSDEENMEEENGSMLNVNDGLFNLGGDEPEEVKEHECLDDKVTCGICGHSCCCANYITVHMETHNDESDMCGKCGKELGDLPATSVKGGRICSICASRSRKQLRLHQILHNRVIQQEPSTGGMKKRFECPHCPKSFTDRKYFREHLRIHTGEKRYHCTFCGMAFAHSRNFKRHIWRHTGEKPNWCNICNKGIAGHLARHMRSHSDEKSYICNMCHKGFNRSEHLKRHLKTHLGTQEEFHCHICPKKYLRKEHLKRHVRSHGEEAGTSINELSPANPYRPPVNDQPYREHPCTYDVAVCGLCGDACCCANYIPFHMEVHGERAEDYIEGTNLKKDVAPRQDGAGEKKVREHSCTYDAVTCGLCGETCCCANYIPLHMELHREKASDLAKDYIPNSANDGILTNPDKVIPKKEPESPQSEQNQVKEHSCLQDRVNCGMCGEACCCTNYIPFHMEQHDEKAPDPVGQDDLLKKALDASEIGERDVKPHPCMHDIVTCGICGEPCCCANYIPFHMELHSEVMDQEPGNQEEGVCVANPVAYADQDIADTEDAAPVIADPLVDTEEAVVPPEAAEAPEDGVATVAVAAPEAVQGQVVNNGHAVMEEHVEEFDWASVANFLQGTREPDPLPVPPLLASGSNMEPLNGSLIKEEPSGGHIGENQVMDHVCLQAQVTCETCGDVLCCINNLIFHLDTHKVVSVRCELCQLDVNITKTVSVLKDGMKIYKCGTCVMGMTAMSTSPSRTPQVRVGTPSGTVDKSLPCPHCNRVLKSRKEYTRHVKIHADIKPYKCDLCDKEFTAMANLRRHLDAHSGVKPHECKICGQFFSGHMARHMRTHTGEKKYSCDICSKGFHRLEHLKRHLGQHVKDGSSPSNCKQLRELGITADTAQSSEASPSKPNWCNICQKTIPGRLARHMLTHSDVKPFQCTQCEKAFTRSEHLKRHLEVHARRGEFSGVQSRP